LLTASTPVIAVQPLAKARMRSQKPRAAVASGSFGGVSTGSRWPPLTMALNTPTITMPPSDAIKRYVGNEKAQPASPVPPRFMSVTMARIARQSATVYGCSASAIETSAATPAEIATATFRT